MTETTRTALPNPYADHLSNADDHVAPAFERVTLCGRAFSVLPVQVGIWDYRDGFADHAEQPCEQCAAVVAYAAERERIPTADMAPYAMGGDA